MSRRIPSADACVTLAAIVLAIVAVVGCASSPKRPEEVPIKPVASAAAPVRVVPTPAPAPVSTALPPGANGPSTAEEMIGAPGRVVPSDTRIVTLFHSKVIRSHASAARFRSMVQNLYIWREYARGAAIDPIDEVDWMIAAMPDFVRTPKDIFIVRHLLSDAAVDVIAQQHKPNTPLKTGTTGTRARAIHTDDEDRALVIVPPRHFAVVEQPAAANAARTLSEVPAEYTARAGEAFRIVWREPRGGLLSLPSGALLMRAWLNLETDGGGAMHGEIVCADSWRAGEMAAALTESIAQKNTGIVRMVTHGVLNEATVRVDGSTVRVAIPATADQMEALLAAVGMMVNALGP